MRERSGNKKITAIIPSAGKSKRFGRGKNKIITELAGKPLLYYSLKALEASPLVASIIVVTDKRLIGKLKRIISRYRFLKVNTVIEGGKTRTESVKRGLRLIDGETDYVLIHDGARPLLSGRIIKDTIEAALRFGASVSAVPVKNTVKLSNRELFVRETPDRKRLWEVHTPQVFKKDILLDAYRRVDKNRTFTDDASVVEDMGVKVKIVKGDYRNIKVTTPYDLVTADRLLNLR
ncbi:MAG: 2-C-methyl-D-erythritol 4-phosphate cytidylyltransferase [Candidatus Omnitrophica bacterium]|nr:2-C-methyl-D-erythritol 4-phosphate cytidylyltransferase [Candidatus Omnitrophota bacterium]